MDVYNANQELRGILNEATPAQWSERTLLDCLNRAQLRIGMEISQTIGDWFLTKSDVTVTNGLISLPATCAKPAFIKQASTNLVIPISMRPQEQGLKTFPSSYEHIYHGSYEAYLYGNYIQINTSSLSGTFELWFEKKIKDLHYGTAAAGGAGTLTLSASLPRSYTDDYYNEMTILIYSGTGSIARKTITDYTGTSGVLALEGTYDNTSVYSFESLLPEEAYDYWIAQAAMIAMAKPSSVVDKEAITWIKQDFRDAKEIFNDWASTRVKDNIYMMRK